MTQALLEFKLLQTQAPLGILIFEKEVCLFHRDRQKTMKERNFKMFDMTEIGRRIETYRKEKGMTQMGLANQLGVSYQAVSNWERGVSMPDISKLEELSKELGASIDEILGRKKF